MPILLWIPRLLLAQALVAPPVEATVPVSGWEACAYVPHRVYDSDRKRFSDFETMLADLARADVIFVGEQHDDAAGHRLELAALAGLMRRRGPVVVSLEMFERDAQTPLDEYLAGRTQEDAFVRASRPWPRYATDYRPLLEFAKAQGWPVIAANVPRPLASAVAKQGLAAVDALPPDERRLAARELQCPTGNDDYFKAFAAQMPAHPMPGSEKQSWEERRATTDRFYYAQCLKDETMAESIADARAGAGTPPPLIVHFNGAFHSDYGRGAAERTRRRVPRARVAIVTIVPVDNLDGLKPSKSERARADFILYTLKSN